MQGFKKSNTPEGSFLEEFMVQKTPGSSMGRGGQSQLGRGSGKPLFLAARGGGSGGGLVQAGSGRGVFPSSGSALMQSGKYPRPQAILPHVSPTHNPYMQMDPQQLEDAIKQYAETRETDVRTFDQGFKALVMACTSFDDADTNKDLMIKLVWIFVFSTTRLPNAALERLLTNENQPAKERIATAKLLQMIVERPEFNMGPGKSFRVYVKNWLSDMNNEMVYNTAPAQSRRRPNSSWVGGALALYNQEALEEPEPVDDFASSPFPSFKRKQNAKKFAVLEEEDEEQETLQEKRKRLQHELAQLNQAEKESAEQEEIRKLEELVQQKKQARVALAPSAPAPGTGPIRQGTGFSFGASTSLAQAMALQEKEAVNASLSDADRLAAQQLAAEQQAAAEAQISKPQGKGRGKAKELNLVVPNSSPAGPATRGRGKR